MTTESFDDFKCKFCGAIFKHKSSLIKHVETAKFCLQIQNNIEPVKEIKKFICEYCDTEFKAKRNLQSHYMTCKEKEIINIKTRLEEEHIKEINNLKLDHSKELVSFKTEYLEIINEQKITIAELNGKIQIYERDHKLLHDKINELSDFNNNESIKKDLEFAELKGMLKSNKENHILKKQINNEDTTFKLILENSEVINIGIRNDGYINATQLCKAGSKEFKHYKENKQMQDYLQALSSVVGIPTTEFISIKQGGINQGTYVHRKVGYHLAQWISPYFAVQVSNILDNLFITGRVELGNEKSNIELENIYQEKIYTLQNKLKNYETTIFSRNIDYCPIEYYEKDIIYFIKFNIPIHLYSNYISKYPSIDNEEYNCIEFGVTSDIEERLKSHKRDKRKDNLIFLHAIELKKRYTASKMEFYIKTIAKQLNIKFYYEKNKECILVNEEMFNVLINKINTGLYNTNDEKENENENENEKEVEDCEENEISNYKYQIEIKKLDNEIVIEKEKEKEMSKKEINIKKIESITDLFKNKLITFDDYKNMLEVL